MPKKSSSVKAPEKMPENPVVEEDEKPSSKLKKLGNEIDEIFACKKRKKPEEKKTKKMNKDETVELKLVKKKKEKKSRGNTEDGFADPPARSRKRMEDGLTVYTEDELGINNADAGNTPLCPFDCSCCF